MPNELKVLVGMQIPSGHEAVRSLLVLFAWIGTAVGAVTLALTVLGVPMMLLPGGDGLFAAIGAVVGQGIAVAIPAYVLWCLRQQDVQNWMMRRSLNLDD